MNIPQALISYDDNNNHPTHSQNQLPVYLAGVPGYTRNFSRDAFYSGFMINDYNLLENQIAYSMSLQGQKANPLTGEEPGKIHHEYPEVIMNNRSTLFNACDTTGLFLLAIGKMLEHDSTFLQRNLEVQNSMQKAIDYILSHLDDKGMFQEDPKHCQDTEFALKVTYWKDSRLAHRKDGEPVYPVAYFVNQAITLAAFRSLQSINFLPQIKSEIVPKLEQGLKQFFVGKTIPTVIDTEGSIEFESSDILHALFFLEPNDIPASHLDFVTHTISKLATPFGFRTNIPELCQINHSYHSCTLWPFEQAIIHAGLLKFGFESEAVTATKIYEHISTPENAIELFLLDNTNTVFIPQGCNPQLWTLAAAEYFRNFLGVEYKV